MLIVAGDGKDDGKRRESKLVPLNSLRKGKEACHVPWKQGGYSKDAKL